MAPEWSTATVGEFCPFRYGKGLRKDERCPTGHVPVFGSNGVVGYHDRALTDGPTVIVGRKGTVGVARYSDAPCWPIDTTFYVTGPDPDLVRFKYYALRSLGLEHANADSAVPGLNRADAHAHRMAVPAEPEQRGIARILGTLDDKIELNCRMSSTLDAMAQALFKSWFIDFEPVRAKMEGRSRQCLDDLFPAKLVQTGLGEVPEGWPVRTLNNLMTFNYGKSLRKDKRIPGDYPVFGSGGTETSHIEPLVGKPTVVVGRKGTVGSIQWAPDGCWPIDTTFYVTSDLPMTFLYRLLRAIPLHDMNTDAAVPGLNRSNAYRLEVPFPGTKLVAAFTEICASLQGRIDILANESRSLAQIRDHLLPKLIVGEIRLPQAEDAVAAAA